jgi:hypothetical protein
MTVIYNHKDILLMRAHLRLRKLIRTWSCSASRCKQLGFGLSISMARFKAHERNEDSCSMLLKAHQDSG